MAAQLLIAPVIGVPIAGLLRYNSLESSDSRVGNSFLITTWLLSGFLGPSVAGAAQMAMAYPAAKFMFGDRLSDYMNEFGRSEQEVKLLDPETIALRKEMSTSWQNMTSILFISTLAPATEEIFKCIALRFVARYYPQKARTKRAYVTVAMAIGLGFGLVENLAFIWSGREETQAKIAQNIIERGIFGTSGHLLTAALTGCKFAQNKEAGMWTTIKESLLYHGLGNAGLLAISTWYGNVGWVRPSDPFGIAAVLALLVGVNGMAAWRIAQELGKIDARATRKAL